MNKHVMVGAAFLLCAGQATADDAITLRCEVTSKTKASFAPEEVSRTVLGVNVISSGQVLRRITVFDKGDKLAILDATSNAKIKGHASVNSSDSQRWSLYNTWAAAYGDPESTRISIDRNSGDIMFEKRIHTGGDWQSYEYFGNCNKVGGNNTKF
jgi:hypothetical protein